MDIDPGYREPPSKFSPKILEDIEKETIWTRLLYDDSAAADMCKVQFTKATIRVFQEDFFFTITLAKEVPRRTHILLLFPEERKVLDLTKTRDLHVINKFIDQYISKQQNTSMPQMVMVLGDTLYKVTGVTGRLYMQWADCVEYVSGRNPSRWMQTPLLASTNGHFKMTGLFPVFSQHRLESFVHPDCCTFYVPKGCVVWSLDTQLPDPPLEHEALPEAIAANRTQRDMIPDHELPKYQRRKPRAAATAATASITHDSESETDGTPRLLTDGGTASDDYESVTVIISDLPTPRPFQPTQAATTVLNSSFFDLDPELPAPRIPADFRPSRTTSQGDDRMEATAAPSAALNALNYPLLGLYSAPKDSTAFRQRPGKPSNGSAK